MQHRIVVPLAGVQSHPLLEAGKKTNLAIAAAHFDGRCISSSAPFSFWRLLGRPRATRGFVPGTEIREGCVVPSIGGGLCLLSGALFRLAAEMNYEVLERHGHTVESRDMHKIDATVSWPQVDLRFAPRQGQVVLRVRVIGDSLIVESHGIATPSPLRVWRDTLVSIRSGSASNSNESVTTRIIRELPDGVPEVLGTDHKTKLSHGLARNCLSCGEQSCEARDENLEVMR